MHTEQSNLYEQAFASFLDENKIPYVGVDQSKRPEFQHGMVKNFDFLVHPESDSPILIELKGRTFKGDSLVGLKGLEAWATFEDVRSLLNWLEKFQEDKPPAQASIVFAFHFANIDVESDGMSVYDFSGVRFLFLTIPLQKYADAMKIRSPKWQTVVLPAEDFRQWATPIDEILKK